MTDIDEIKARHEETETAKRSGSKAGSRMYAMLLPAAHKDRKWLIAEVKRLQKIVTELDSANKERLRRIESLRKNNIAHGL